MRRIYTNQEHTRVGYFKSILDAEDIPAGFEVCWKCQGDKPVRSEG